MGYVAQLLANHVHTVIVPSTHARADLFPWGSHPDLDPLWSSDDVRVEHHGIDTTRSQKISAIAESAVAMRHLRVCWKNTNETYNCGTCEKCIRTKIGLRAAAAECATLPGDIHNDAVRGLKLGLNGLPFAQDVLAAVRGECPINGGSNLGVG